MEFFKDKDILKAISELNSIDRKVQISTLFQKLKELNCIAYEVTGYSHLIRKLNEMRGKGLVSFRIKENDKGEEYISPDEEIIKS